MDQSEEIPDLFFYDWLSQRRGLTMTAYKQKLYALERAIQPIEKLDQNKSFAVSDKSLQALYKTYEKLIDMFIASDESGISDFSAL